LGDSQRELFSPSPNLQDPSESRPKPQSTLPTLLPKQRTEERIYEGERGAKRRSQIDQVNFLKKRSEHEHFRPIYPERVTM
jgi:hypothetical protein